jgi:hypothetical protein
MPESESKPEGRSTFPSSMLKWSQTQVKGMNFKKDKLAAICIEKLQSIGMEKEKRAEVIKALRERQSLKDYTDATIRVQLHLAGVYLERVGWKSSKSNESSKK